jgi:NAD(P)-dependent dehydrogenase (short-subunit alcohol dehydrogenase family)
MSIETTPLDGQRVLVLGTGDIGADVAAIVADAGGTPVVAGRDAARAAQTAAPLGAPSVTMDLEDEASIVAGLTEAGPLDHLVSTAGAAANGPVTDLEIGAIDRAVRAKLSGAVLLAKHAAPRLADHASLTFFSGFVAWRPQTGQAVMAMTNGGLAHLAPALAVELAPRRVNVISPGVVDSGLWDGLGADLDEFFERTAATTPARRVGRPRDIAEAVLFAMTNTFLTGSVLHVDGGARWA